MIEEEKELQRLTCAAGHQWEREPRRDRPHACPVHAHWWTMPLPVPCEPNQREVAAWENTEETIVNEDGYAARWREFWEETVRVIAARAGSWLDVDIALVEEYVRAKRLSELHRMHAEDEPYFPTNTGVRAHPGWKLTREFAADAQIVGRKLGLIAAEPARGGHDRKWPASRLEIDLHEQHGSNDAVIDSQVGPDGRSL